MVDSGLHGVTEVIQLLTRCESLTALIRISALSKNQINMITELSLGKSAPIDDLTNIYKKTNCLEILINSIPPFIDTAYENITLKPDVAQLLFVILKKICLITKYPTRKLVKATSSSELDFFTYFPGLTNNYLIPKYEGCNVERDSKCTKIYPKHNRFSPGLLVMTCHHQRCYGFEIMSSHESTLMVYNLLLKKFDKPLKVIIYDNACNLCIEHVDEGSCII